MSDKKQEKHEGDSAALPEWALGISPSDIVGVLDREIRSIMKHVKGDQLKALKLGFERLLSAKIISSRDSKRLYKTFVTIYSAEKGKLSSKKASKELELLYHESLMDADSSDAANTVIGVAYSRKDEMAIGGLLGMGIGAVIGGIISGTGPFGGSVGARVGAIVGAVVGSWAAGVCDANN